MKVQIAKPRNFLLEMYKESRFCSVNCKILSIIIDTKLPIPDGITVEGRIICSFGIQIHGNRPTSRKVITSNHLWSLISVLIILYYTISIQTAILCGIDLFRNQLLIKSSIFIFIYDWKRECLIKTNRFESHSQELSPSDAENDMLKIKSNNFEMVSIIFNFS